MLENNLKDYFPNIQTQMSISQKINNTPHLKHIYDAWSTEQKKEFLNFMTGAAGVKMLYDSFFKEIMNPELAPERINRFLSLVLNQKVTIKEVLPTDSTRLADETSLLIADIVVELEDGSIANLEVQKVGYLFPGQRAACYSSDLLLRQYKRIRDEKKKDPKDKRPFNYRNIKKVYTIILVENSTSEFHKFPNVYHHYFTQKSDSGIVLNLLQEYCFIPLDIFKEILHNEGITNELGAWLTFFSMDDPHWIIRLIKEYPYFKAMYDNIYQLCLNIEEVMGMFSKELAELDRNTVLYMVDEMQAEIAKKQELLVQQQQELAKSHDELAKSHDELARKDTQIEQMQAMIEQLRQQLSQPANTPAD